MAERAVGTVLCTATLVVGVPHSAAAAPADGVRGCIAFGDAFDSPNPAVLQGYMTNQCGAPVRARSIWDNSWDGACTDFAPFQRVVESRPAVTFARLVDVVFC